MSEEKKVKRVAMIEETNVRGVGLDVGTCFLVGAKQLNDKVQFTKVRDAFFSMAPNKVMQDTLKRAGVGFVEMDDQVIVVGDKALGFASSMGLELRRPMSQGVFSQDCDAEAVMAVLLEKTIGEASFPTEVCRFSVPAEPIDAEFDVIFHEGVFTALISELGYNPKPLNEAEAVAYSELSGDDDNLTGVAVSCGAGMTNVAVMYYGKPITTFSLARGGDWIDSMSYKNAMLRSAAEMTSFKEKGEIDLVKPGNRKELALATYYRHHCQYVVEKLVEQLKTAESIPNFEQPVKVVVSGGTSKANGYVKLFENELDKYTLPFAVKEIMTAGDQLTATANGCLIAARLDEGE